MHTPRRKSNGKESIAGKIKPSALHLAIIRQFSQCMHIEKDLDIPDKILFLN